MLARLTPGTIYDVVMTADGHATKVIAGVPVPSASSITAVSTAGTPLTLSPSSSQNITGTVTLNPADDDGTVLVAAKQALNGGPTVTARWQVASVLSAAPTGDYSYNLLLPIARPSLGSFSTALPISFSEQSVMVGGAHTVYGAAQTPTAVYGTQTPAPSQVNITSGGARAADSAIFYRTISHSLIGLHGVPLQV